MGRMLYSILTFPVFQVIKWLKGFLWDDKAIYDPYVSIRVGAQKNTGFALFTLPLLPYLIDQWSCVKKLTII
jgi:hypothetical protein